MQSERPPVAPNEHSYCATINACAKADDWRTALSLLEGMEHKGVRPNTECFNAALHGLSRGGQGEKAGRDEMRCDPSLAFSCANLSYSYDDAWDVCDLEELEMTAAWVFHTCMGCLGQP